MKVIPQFVVAKYIPDLHRLEPRNVGVIAWGDGGVTAARFLGERDDGSLRFPSLIERASRHAYREWVTYWRYQLNAMTVRNNRGEEVRRESPELLTALRGKSKDAFRLVDGGQLMDKVAATALPEFVNELYSKLVEREHAVVSPKTEAAEFAVACRELLRSTGIDERPDYHPNLPVPRHVHGVLRYFNVDVALGAIGNPSVVIQRVLVAKSQSVDSNAFMFGTLTTDPRRPIPRENCAALVNSACQRR